MGLIDLQTDLKSLKFGKDRFGGGDSGQPYIKTPIITEPGKLSQSDDDFLFRGGTRTPVRALEDVVRLTKYLSNPKSPSGFLFGVKQNLLSRVAVATEASIGKAYGNGPGKELAWTKAPLNQGIYTPLSTLLQAGVGFSGVHANLLGINPLTPTVNTKGSNNPLTDNGGFLPNLGLIRYEDVVRGKTIATKTVEKTIIVPATSTSNSSRARVGGGGGIYRPTPIQTKKVKEKVPISTYENRLLYLWGKDMTNTDNSGGNLLEYSGGPGSVLGIGKTRIKFADQRTGLNNPLYKTNPNYFLKGGEENKLHGSDDNAELNSPTLFQASNVAGLTDEEIGLNGDGIFQLNSNYNYIDNKKDTKDNKIYKVGGEEKNINPNELIETRVNLGDPGAVAGSKTSPLDKINASKVYTTTGRGKGGINKEGEISPYNDLVHFRIGIVDPGNPNITTYMNFRAFIDGFSDSYNADWKSQQYMGRGEKFYKYQSFERDISLAFTVAAQSQAEMYGMYQKLNTLASSLAPTYTGAGYMAGNLSKLTVGDYIYEQPGFISSLTYDIPDESPWEITYGTTGMPDELPFIIKVTGFKFTPIHEFRPEFNRGKISGKSGRFITHDLNLNKSLTNFDIEAEEERKEEEAAERERILNSIGI